MSKTVAKKTKTIPNAPAGLIFDILWAGGPATERTRRFGSEHQAATAQTGGPQPAEESAAGSPEQLGQTTISRTISEPTPPGSSVFFGWPSLRKRFASFRKGYSRRRVSTTFRCAGVLGGTTTPQRWHRYNRDSLPLDSRGG
jgi:hypothetical protein